MNETRSKMRLARDEADVVIVGAGSAGLAAAIESAAAKANVVVWEKQGGIEDSSTCLSGGVFTFAGTDFQQKRGIQDSDNLLYQDLMEVGHWKSDEKLVQTYVRNQLDAYRWLTGFGVKWDSITQLAGMSVPRGHVTDPMEAHRILKGAAEGKGVRLYFEAKAVKLLVDEANRVTGVSVEEKGRNLTVKARRGVILATGGFGRDTKRLEGFDPRLRYAVPTAGLGHTGDGHRMAEELGAFLTDMENVKLTFGIHPTGTSVAALAFLFYLGAIIVNKRGERFVNESISYKDIGKASLDQPDGVGFQVFDHKIYEASWTERRGLGLEETPFGLDDSRRKLVVEAQTLEGLASKIGVPAEALNETVARYNKYVGAGKDLDFGRASLVAGTGKVIKIDTPPFYAFESKGMLSTTYAGIAIDEDMHVLNRRGRIPGLYAAGEIVGGFHGASYMSGSALTKAIVFGRIAGRNAAKRQ